MPHSSQPLYFKPTAKFSSAAEAAGYIQRRYAMMKLSRKRFMELLKPRRPPLPATATPGGYLLHKIDVKHERPDSASDLDKLRDWSRSDARSSPALSAH